MLRHFLLALWIAIGPALPPSAFARTATEATQNEPLLAVTLEDGTVVSLDRATLEGLPQQAFTTSTPWTEGLVDFSGPSFRAVLDHLAIAPDRAIVARAANDYRVVLEPRHIEPHAPIIATRMNGAAFSLRDLGPLWVVFPYDSSDRYRSEEAISLSIWQLVDLTVRP